MSTLFLLVTITDRRSTDAFLQLYESHGVNVSLRTVGSGTAVRETLATLGLEKTEKAVLLAVVTEDTWKAVRTDLRRKMRIDVPGTGIAFTVPLSSIGGRRALMFLTQHQPLTLKEESTLKDTRYELLLVIANQGHTGTIMDAARAAGAGGGTVIHAKGTGTDLVRKFFGVSIASEQEMVFILARSEAKKPIMKAIMAKAGISSRLVAFADDCVGHRRGGIAIVAVIVACFFGAISGSGPATVAALGIILIPAMINRGGFSAPFASAMMATASSIAIVIPPSIAFVVYASITGVSVGDMFMGGWIPGIMMGLSLVIIIMIECRKKGIQASKAKSSWGQRWKSFREAFWGFLMPVIIIGGIYGGVFTPTEAAAVSVVYGLVVGVFIYREVKMKDMIDILVDSGKTTGGIMLIIGAATLFSYVCTVFGIAQAAQALLLEISGNKYIFLLIVNVIFLIAGCFVDANSAMYIFIPIMYPVATQLGIDPVHFGVIATVNLAIGQVTPPVGVNLFVAIGVSEKLQGLRDKTKVTIVSMSKAVWPQIVACIIALLLITYVPWFSTVLLFGK